MLIDISLISRIELVYNGKEEHACTTTVRVILSAEKWELDLSKRWKRVNLAVGKGSE